MTNITKAEEITSVRQVILDMLNDNISDPLTGKEARAFNSHWIFEGFPNPAKLGQVPPSEDRPVGTSPGGWKFPIIVFDFPEPDTEPANVIGTRQFIEDSITIECHARNRLQANTVAQEVKNILETTANSNLRNGTLHMLSVTSSLTISDFIGGNKYYTKSIEYTFRRVD